MDAKNDTGLIGRLRVTLEKMGISVSKFETETGIPKDRVYKWLKRGTGKIDHTDALKVEHWLKINLDKVPHETSYVQQRNHKKNTSERKIPLFDAPAAAGLTESERHFKKPWHKPGKGPVLMEAFGGVRPIPETERGYLCTHAAAAAQRIDDDTDLPEEPGAC